MSALDDYIDGREAEEPGWRKRTQAENEAFFAQLDAGPDEDFSLIDCSTHREPRGPNEDLAQCPKCWSITYAMRPVGETFGWHLADCSLEMRHEDYCQPGGIGHIVPEGEKIRGYFPPRVPLSSENT